MSLYYFLFKIRNITVHNRAYFMETIHKIYSPLLSLAKMFVEIPAIGMRSVLFLIPFSLRRVQSLLKSTFIIIEHYATNPRFCCGNTMISQNTCTLQLSTHPLPQVSPFHRPQNCRSTDTKTAVLQTAELS